MIPESLTKSEGFRQDGRRNGIGIGAEILNHCTQESLTLWRMLKEFLSFNNTLSQNGNGCYLSRKNPHASQGINYKPVGDIFPKSGSRGKNRLNECACMLTNSDMCN